MALHPGNIQGYNNKIMIAGSDAGIAIKLRNKRVGTFKDRTQFILRGYGPPAGLSRASHRNCTRTSRVLAVGGLSDRKPPGEAGFSQHGL